jgi:glycerophosphoryl diester phosphodiesterase
MDHREKRMFSSFFIFIILITGAQAADRLVITHRGAGGYLPEQSIATISMAHVQSADLIEIDLVMTSDNRIVVLHASYLNKLSYVPNVFSDRARKDGKYYVVDFILEELRSLKLSERFDEEWARFPDRFPAHKSSFEIFTFSRSDRTHSGFK